MNDQISVDFNLYKSFYFVAKEKSFSKAAECLFVTQPLVSNNVRNLEDILKVKLFDRTTKSVVLTSEGQYLFNQIEHCYNNLVDIERSMKMIHDFSLGEIKIGVTNDIGVYYVSDIVKKFSDQYPQIKFCLLDKKKDNLTIVFFTI